MMKDKKAPLSADEIYKENRKKAKLFNFLSPIVFWVLLALAGIFFVLTISNSIGNVTEILALLDKDTHTQEEIVANYQMLVDKWGEWEIIGADSAGLVIRYVDVRNALFSGLMIVYTILTVVFLLMTVIIGKVLFPQLAKLYTNNNDEMVDVATLKSAQQIDEMTKKKSANKEDWF